MTPEQTRRSIFANFLVSSTGTGLSRVLGLFRDTTISHYFGASKVSDIFWVAFTIPNVFRRFVADEGLTGAIIPTLSQEERREGRPEAEKLSNAAFTFIVFANVVLCFLGILFAPSLFLVFGSGFRSDPFALQLGTELTRWLFSFVFFVSLVSFCEGVLNYRGHFFWPKIAPGIVSASIVVAVPLFYQSLSQPIFSIVIGVLAGGVLHFLVQLPLMRRYWTIPRLTRDFTQSRFRLFLAEMGKVLAIGIFAQINIIILRSLATNLEVGSVTWYWYAVRLVDLAQGIIAVGMGSAILPALAHSIADRDWSQFQDHFSYSISMSMYILLPVGFGLALWTYPTVSMVFRHGDFSTFDVHSTAEVLFYLVPSMWALAGINIVKKVYFALNDRTPLIVIGAFGSALIFTTGFLFMRYWGVIGLSMALSLTSLVQLGLYLVRLKLRLKKKFMLMALARHLLKMTAAAISSAMLLLLFQSFGEWQHGPASLANFVVYGAGWLLLFAAYLGLTRLMRLPEFSSFLSVLRRKQKP